MVKVFISYSHKQGDWVWERLVPCLKAGGAEVLIDKERFKIGKAVVGQMDAMQDQAEKHLLVLSPDYLSSDYCQHEMNRALKKDPKFTQGIVLPVLHIDCALPKPFTGWNPPLYANFKDDSKAEPWTALLRECGATGLGATAPDWLRARDDIVRFLENGNSVNLVVNGNKVNWRGLIAHLVEVHFQDLAVVDLENPNTTSRHGLLQTISHTLGNRTPLRVKPHDLSDFQGLMEAGSRAKVALTHFDLTPHRRYYNVDLFAALRHLVMDKRKLLFLIQSRIPFGVLLPKDHPLSDINIKTVELKGQP